MKEKNLLFGNGLTSKIIFDLKNLDLPIMTFNEYVYYFFELDEHKREKRDFIKIFLGHADENEIEDTEEFIKEHLSDILESFEKSFSTYVFNNEMRLIKNASAYIFCLFNYWYSKQLVPHENNHTFRNLICSIAENLKTKGFNNYYTLNFDMLLDGYLHIKHNHGKFVKNISQYLDIISSYYNNGKNHYRKFLFGTQGVEKLNGLVEMKNANQPEYDFEFLFDNNKDFGDLTIFGVAFGESKIIPDELPNYNDFFTMNCVEGHILLRLDALFENHKISSIKIVYYSDKDRANYEKLFTLLKCNSIVSYESTETFWIM